MHQGFIGALAEAASLAAARPTSVLILDLKSGFGPEHAHRQHSQCYNIAFCPVEESFMQLRIGSPLLAVLCALLLTGTCGAAPLVVTTIHPLHLLVSEVAAPEMRVEGLIPSGYSPHDYQLRPSQRMQLTRADVVFWMGPALETGLASLLSDSVLQAPVHALAERAWDSGGDAHDWLDPRAAGVLAEQIAAILGRLDPDQAGVYRERARQLKLQLSDLEEELAELLRPMQQRRYWVAHDAYGQFEARFGLQHAAVVAPSPERVPGAGHVLALRRQQQQERLDCVFRERQYDPAILPRVLADSGVEVVELDPLATDFEPERGAFVNFLRQFGRRFAACGQE